MRSVVYIVAALAALGIIVAFVLTPSQTPGPAPTAATSSTAELTAADSELTDVDTDAGQDSAGADVKTLVLNVPEMHCPFACYPSVKKTLESDIGVVDVTLAKQEVEGVIDNPQVIVKVRSDFDIKTAIADLAQQGFKNSELVQ